MLCLVECSMVLVLIGTKLRGFLRGLFVGIIVGIVGAKSVVVLVGIIEHFVELVFHFLALFVLFCSAQQ